MKNEILDSNESETKPKPIIKIWHIGLVYIVGSLVALIGILFKLQSWEGGPLMFTIGRVMLFIGGILIIGRLLSKGYDKKG